MQTTDILLVFTKIWSLSSSQLFSGNMESYAVVVNCVCEWWQTDFMFLEEMQTMSRLIRAKQLSKNIHDAHRTFYNVNKKPSSCRLLFVWQCTVICRNICCLSFDAYLPVSFPDSLRESLIPVCSQWGEKHHNQSSSPQERNSGKNITECFMCLCAFGDVTPPFSSPLHIVMLRCHGRQSSPSQLGHRGNSSLKGKPCPSIMLCLCNHDKPDYLCE